MVVCVENISIIFTLKMLASIFEKAFIIGVQTKFIDHVLKNIVHWLQVMRLATGNLALKTD